MKYKSGNPIKTEAQIVIENAARGDLKAQKRIFEQYYGYVMSITLRYMSSSEEAEEALNDCFLKVLTRLDQYDHGYPLKAWIRKIAINTSIDRLRASGNQAHIVPLENQHNVQGEEPVDFGMDSTVPILPVLQALPPQYRLVFNLYVFEEYKHHEIAEILGISVGTSKSNYARARKNLKKVLESRKGRSQNEAPINQRLNNV